MNYPSLDETRKLISLAENRLQRLKAIATAMDTLDAEGASDLRIAIGDVITPLNVAMEEADNAFSPDAPQ